MSNTKKDSKKDKPESVDQQVAATDTPPPATIQTPIFKYDEYWLGRGKEFVDNSIPNLKDKAKNYATFLDTISAATFLGGLTLTTYLESTDGFVFFLVFGPIVFLQIAKYMVQIGNTDSLLQDIDNRNPQKINEAHNQLVKHMNTGLEQSKKWVLLATLYFLISLPLGIFINNVHKPVEFKQFHSIAINNHEVQISGNLVDIEKLEIAMSGLNKSSKDTLLTRDVSIKKNTTFQVHFHMDQLPLNKLKKVEVRYGDQSFFKLMDVDLVIEKDSSQVK